MPQQRFTSQQKTSIFRLELEDQLVLLVISAAQKIQTRHKRNVYYHPPHINEKRGRGMLSELRITHIEQVLVETTHETTSYMTSKHRICL